MLYNELREITLKCVDENEKFKNEYETIVKILKDSAENGHMSTRIKNISPCVLNRLRNEGMQWSENEHEGNVFYNLNWM